MDFTKDEILMLTSSLDMAVSSLAQGVVQHEKTEDKDKQRMYIQKYLALSTKIGSYTPPEMKQVKDPKK